LGERLNGIQEVRGSTPLGSTFYFLLINHQGTKTQKNSKIKEKRQKKKNVSAGAGSCARPLLAARPINDKII
jgi:hypothetical protein